MNNNLIIIRCEINFVQFWLYNIDKKLRWSYFSDINVIFKSTSWYFIIILFMRLISLFHASFIYFCLFIIILVFYPENLKFFLRNLCKIIYVLI